MKKFYRILFAALFAAVLCSCGKLDDISLSNCHLGSVKAVQTRTIELSASADVCNEGPVLKVYSLSGPVEYDGRIIGHVEVSPFEIARKSRENKTFKATFTLGKDVSLFEMLGLLKGIDPGRAAFQSTAEFKSGAFRTRKKFTLHLNDFIRK